MAHYICKGGCKGVSETPGVCTTEDCPKKGQPFEQCDCVDEKHNGAFDPSPETKENSEDKQ